MTKGFFTDAEGNKSSKRLMQIIATISGIILSYIICILALVKAQADIGSNMALLCGMLVGAGIGGGIGTAFANKGENKK